MFNLTDLTVSFKTKLVIKIVYLNKCIVNKTTLCLHQCKRILGFLMLYIFKDCNKICMFVYKNNNTYYVMWAVLFIQVAYTFDAGPNACLYLEEKSVPEVLALILHAFPPPPDSDNYVKGIPFKQIQFNQVRSNCLNL